MKTTLRIFCLLALFISPVKGEKAYKVVDSKSIKNLDAALQKAEKTLGFPVFFPPFIPGQTDKKETPYYAYFDKAAFPTLSFSLDENCHGVKACTTGSITIKPSASPEMRTDMSGKPITEVVNLTKGIKGYYTPGHPMADFWPPSLQWVEGTLLYDLSWSGMDEATARKALMDMANSAIHAASQKKATH